MSQTIMSTGHQIVTSKTFSDGGVGRVAEKDGRLVVLRGSGAVVEVQSVRRDRQDSRDTICVYYVGDDGKKHFWRFCEADQVSALSPWADLYWPVNGCIWGQFSVGDLVKTGAGIAIVTKTFAAVHASEFRMGQHASANVRVLPKSKQAKAARTLDLRAAKKELDSWFFTKSFRDDCRDDQFVDEKLEQLKKVEAELTELGTL